MAIDHLPDNLRLLCSYGRSTSEICRRAGINRQQFSKYLNGQARPSLSTLRRICDFFGVDDNEVLLDKDDFKKLIRLRPPRLGGNRHPLERAVADLVQESTNDQDLLETHEGYYHTYICTDPARRQIHRSLSRIYRKDGIWLSKSIERNLATDVMVPPTLKYAGIVLEALRRIVIYEREQGSGRSLWAYMLYASDYAEPSFLSGLTLGMWPDGSHDINCMRTVWQYLGEQPNLRDALAACGTISLDSPDLPEFVRYSTDNTQAEGEAVFFARF